MRCSNCGKILQENITKCPYCKTSVTVKKDSDPLIEKRKKQIDRLVFGDVDYEDIYQESIQNLEESVRRLELLLAHPNQDSDRINNSLYKIDDVLQERYPVRDSVSDNLSELGKFSTSKSVELFLTVIPPKTSLAGFLIRMSVEKQLRDFFKVLYAKHQSVKMFVKDISPEGIITPFKNSWERFNVATNDETASKELAKNYSYLNKFVHSSIENDRIIEQRFPTLEDQANLLKEIYRLFKKYNLIWE